MRLLTVLTTAWVANRRRRASLAIAWLNRLSRFVNLPWVDQGEGMLVLQAMQLLLDCQEFRTHGVL
jgi:hypothetical protein